MPTPTTDEIVLQHIIVVAGDTAEWCSMDDAAWQTRLHELGEAADAVGARWLVVRPYGPASSDTSPRTATAHSASVGSCIVAAQPDDDGRVRLARAIASIHSDGIDITEDTIDERMNRPADVDPDLVVVLGPSDRMPPSLVWELAYSEVVFVDCDWQHFGRHQLDEAIASFAQRNRRFGGVDDAGD